MAKYLKMAGFVLLFMAVYYIVQMMVGGLFGIFAAINEALGSRGDIDTDAVKNAIMQNTGMIIFISGIVALPFYLIISACRNERFFKAVGFYKTNVRNIGLSVLMGASVSIFIAMILSIIPVDRLFPDYAQLMEGLVGGNNIIFIALGTGIMAPFIEELIFRGLILRELGKHLPVHAAVIIQGLLFGLFHMNLLQGIYAALIGILLGYVFVWGRSIWVPILVHAFINNTSILLSKWFEYELVSYYIILAVVLSSIAAGFSIYRMWRESGVRTSSGAGSGLIL